MFLFLPFITVALGFTPCLRPDPVCSPQDDARLVTIKERIARTTTEGRDILEKVLDMKPESNEEPSVKTLREAVEDFESGNGAFRIEVIGWEAAMKRLFSSEKASRWRIVLHYYDEQKQYMEAEWEYNPNTSVLYHFEFNNAKRFWTKDGSYK